MAFPTNKESKKHFFVLPGNCQHPCESRRIDLCQPRRIAMEKKKIALVSLGHLSCDINGGALPACLPYLRSAHGLDYQATASLMFAYACLSSLIQPLLGWLADRHNKPWFIPLGIALAGFGVAVMGFMQSYWAIFICFAVSGIGAAFFHPEGARFANKVSGSKKGMGLSLFSIGGNAGFILGPMLIVFFLGHFGLHGTAIFGVIAAIMAALLFWQIRQLPATAPRPDPQASVEPQTVEGEELAASDGQKPGVNDWSAFSRLVIVIVCRSVVFAGANTFIPLYWVNALDQSKGAGAAALVLFGAFGVACNVFGGYLSDRMGYVKVIRLAFLMVAPAALLLATADNILVAWLALPLLGAALYLPFSAQVVLGQQLLAHNIGFASGVTIGLSTTLGGMAQPALGWIADTFTLHAVFPVLAGIGLLGCAGAFLLPNPHRK